MDKKEQRRQRTRQKMNRLVTESRYVLNFNLHGTNYGAIKQRTGCDNERIPGILKTQESLIKELEHIRLSTSTISKNRMLYQWSNNHFNKIQNQVIWLGQCFLARLRDFSGLVGKYCSYYNDLKKDILNLRKSGIHRPKVDIHIQESKRKTFESWRTIVSQLSSHYKLLPQYADPLIKALEFKLICVKNLYHNEKYKIKSVRDSLDAVRKLKKKLKRKFNNPKLSLFRGKNSYDIRSYNTMSGLCTQFIPELLRLFDYAVTTDKIYPHRTKNTPTLWKMKNIQAAPVAKKHRNLTANSYKIGTAMLTRRKSAPAASYAPAPRSYSPRPPIRTRSL